MADDNAHLEEPLFDPSLKKKKKKKAVAFSEDSLGVDGGAEAPTDEGPSSLLAPAPTIDAGAPPTDDFSDLKKKKKKKATFDLDELESALDSSTPKPPPSDGAGDVPHGGDALDDFSEIKKRRKSKKAAFDLEAFERELQESSEKRADDDVDEGGDYDEADLGDDVFAASRSTASESGTREETWHGTDRDYTYAELLGRIIRTLQSQNPDLSSGTRKRYTIVPPSVHRDGNKKTIFANIAEICRRMHRQPEHIIQFIFAELGTTGSVDGEKRLVIKGRFQPKQIENVLRRYIVEYVTCKTCKSPDTILTKETRIYFMTCESCGSRRSVSAIKTGFQAQVGKRKKAVQ
ncbi:domain found in IF2B/IF5-domain-containing protein [Cantharellus anzutake]|uniref:domain found in IF2B/IF5-domain-containing protein n=1 Tax=Cantharellus anzutake TaxID=1750568 RepID=UPI0019053E73|nr:domain found in IF2B/IF5-domain-containing protein [Cantharellus anzutake]KAF8333103.1 domain found in IF2B/IF5-domain-containing protein [Cantharellus anzutake]